MASADHARASPPETYDVVSSSDSLMPSASRSGFCRFSSSSTRSGWVASRIRLVAVMAKTTPAITTVRRAATVDRVGALGDGGGGAGQPGIGPVPSGAGRAAGRVRGVGGLGR